MAFLCEWASLLSQTLLSFLIDRTQASSHREKTSSPFQRGRRVFVIAFTISAVVFPLTFGTLIGHYRDQNDPTMEEIFYQLHYNVVAVLLAFFAVVAVGTTIRFQKTTASFKQAQASLKSQIRKVIRGSASCSWENCPSFFLSFSFVLL